MDFPELSRLASGHVEARIIQTAVGLRLFEALSPRPAGSAALAAVLQTEPRATELLLNALVALGLLVKQEGRFSLTEVSSVYLVPGSPKYFGDMILFEGSLWNSWERLEQAVRSGRPVRPADMYQENPRETEGFIRGMDSLVQARGDAAALAQAIDFSDITSLLDVGSGPGSYPIHLCRLYPALKATIFDLPGTLEITRRFVERAGLTERVTLTAGDYRTDAIPGSYQLIFMSNIIHGEGWDENKRLIAKLYGCLREGGRIVIKDHILDAARTAPAAGAIFTLLMLLATSRGRCYAFEEIGSWLAEAGFKGISRADLPPPFPSSLVTAEK